MLLKWAQTVQENAGLCFYYELSKMSLSHWWAAMWVQVKCTSQQVSVGPLLVLTLAVMSPPPLGSYILKLQTGFVNPHITWSSVIKYMFWMGQMEGGRKVYVRGGWGLPQCWLPYGYSVWCKCLRWRGEWLQWSFQSSSPLAAGSCGPVWCSFRTRQWCSHPRRSL